MGVFALFGGDFAILFIDIFVTYSGIGVIFSAKLGPKRQFCARARTNAHAATRKGARKRCFTPHNGCFCVVFAVCALTFYIYVVRETFWSIEIMDLRPKSRVGGGDVWVTFGNPSGDG
jgi:hypothetical protein